MAALPKRYQKSMPEMTVIVRKKNEKSMKGLLPKGPLYDIFALRVFLVFARWIQPPRESGHAREIQQKKKYQVKSGPHFLKLSTPSIGVSTKRLQGTPSSRLRSKKLSHSDTTCAHSARARPAYLLATNRSFRGGIGISDPDVFAEAFASRVGLFCSPSVA